MKVKTLLQAIGVVSITLGAIVPGMVQANEDIIETVNNSEVPYLQSSYLLSNVKSELYRFNLSMVRIHNSVDRDMFLVYRDDLWNSREELSFAIQNLVAYKTSPYTQDNTAVYEKIFALLNSSENYANEQNLLISSRTKFKDSLDYLYDSFNQLKEQESAIQANINSEDRALFENVTLSQEVFESFLKDYFNQTNVEELSAMTKSINKALTNYVDFLQKLAEKYPEISSSVSMFVKNTDKFFESKNPGGLYFACRQKEQELDEFEKKFNDEVKVIYRDIKKLSTKITTRVGF